MPAPLFRFLLCDAGDCDDEDHCFVMHTHTPRFIMEMVPGGHGGVRTADGESPDSPKVLRAVVAACAWFDGE
jgi:hypothetical protein